jgi:hypothetical protein
MCFMLVYLAFKILGHLKAKKHKNGSTDNRTKKGPHSPTQTETFHSIYMSMQFRGHRANIS